MQEDRAAIIFNGFKCHIKTCFGIAKFKLFSMEITQTLKGHKMDSFTNLHLIALNISLQFLTQVQA
jgi:hypothetical protein